MRPANEHGVPQELNIGKITLAGVAPTAVLISLSNLLSRKGAPDYSLITNPVRAFLDESALTIEPMESKEAPTLILNFDDQALVRWAKSQTVLSFPVGQFIRDNYAYLGICRRSLTRSCSSLVGI